MRRVVASLAAVGLVAALVPAVAAGPPSKQEVHATSVYCDALEGDAGTVFFGVWVDDVMGAGGYLEAWTGVPFDGPADLVSDPEGTVIGSADATSVQATIPLIDANGDPAGTAELDASIEAVGEPEEGWQYKNGNRLSRATGTFQALSIAGSLTIGTAVYDLTADCYGDRTDALFFDTNPHSFVTSYRERSAACDVSDGSNTGSAFFFIEDATFYFDIYLWDGPAAPLAAFGSGELVDGAGSATLELFDPETGEPLPGAGSVTVSFTAGDRYSYQLQNGTLRETVSGDLLDVEGEVLLDGGLTFDLGACIGFDGRTKTVETNPNGPKPRGRAPVNDAPSGAIALSIGSRTSTATRAAAVDYEAPYECMIEEGEDGPFELPVQHTVWYKVLGTGGTITVDTAGSDFDTVAAAYTSGAGGYAPVADACVDDVPLDPFGRTLQSAISFETVVGTWYYVQIGGFPDAMPYGNLRVAVR